MSVGSAFQGTRLGWQYRCQVCRFHGPWRSMDDKESFRAAGRDGDAHEHRCKPPLPDEIPDLDFPPPECPVCEGRLEHDGDGWNCYRCCAWWGSDGHFGDVDHDARREQAAS